MKNNEERIQLMPRIRQSISEFLYDEEATIPRGRLLTIGSIMVVLAVLINIQDAFAGHRSHSSHSSHRSHSSHQSHSSHSSHSNHDNHANHNNATPRPTPVPTPHASHGSYINTSRSHIALPDAPAEIYGADYHAPDFASATSYNEPSVTIFSKGTLPITPVPTTTPSPTPSIAPTPTTPVKPATPVMGTPVLPPDTPKL